MPRLAKKNTTRGIYIYQVFEFIATEFPCKRTRTMVLFYVQMAILSLSLTIYPFQLSQTYMHYVRHDTTQPSLSPSFFPLLILHSSLWYIYAMLTRQWIVSFTSTVNFVCQTTTWILMHQIAKKNEKPKIPSIENSHGYLLTPHSDQVMEGCAFPGYEQGGCRLSRHGALDMTGYVPYRGTYLF